MVMVMVMVVVVVVVVIVVVCNLAEFFAPYYCMSIYILIVYLHIARGPRRSLQTLITSRYINGSEGSKFSIMVILTK